MTDRPALNEEEAQVWSALVALAHAMPAGELPSIEGSAQVLRLRSQVGGVADSDKDLAVALREINKISYTSPPDCELTLLTPCCI